jgi:hypothetical protein
MPSTADGPGIESLVVAAEIPGYFAARGIDMSAWSAGPGAYFSRHEHTRSKQLFVTRGSITFNELEVEAPNGIRIPAGFAHEAWVGKGGVDCVEGFEESVATESGPGLE